LGLQDCLYLGNLDAKRDWGHAKDYVEAMWLMLQQDAPEDFVIATGVTTSIRDCVITAFKNVDIDIAFSGKGTAEVGIVAACNHPDYQVPIGTEIIKVDKNYFRPTEVDLLIGDPTKAKTKLGWTPKYTFEALIHDMVSSDLEIFNKEKLLLQAGYQIANEYE
jgi:GDPmannose 4,6-dehydratase